MPKPALKRRLVETMQAAAALVGDAIGCDKGSAVQIVRRAKDAGCEAFLQGSRIDVGLLIPWIKENPDKLKVDGSDLSLKDQKLNEEVRKLRRANDLAESKLIPVLTMQAEIRSMAQAVQGVLLQIPARLAPDLAGHTIANIEAKLKAAVYEAIGKLSRGESS